MRLFRHPIAWFSCLVLLLGTSLGRADAPPDPLRLVPGQADLALQITRPRQLVEAVLGLNYVKGLQSIEAYREFVESTNVQRFSQFLAYFEKELGVSRFELLDRVAGRGAVLAMKFDGNPAPALLVIQGTDEPLLHKFYEVAIRVIESELVRQEAKDRFIKGDYRGIETLTLGKGFHAAIVGSALLVSNVAKGLQAGIDLHLDGDQKSLGQVAGIAEARKLLPAHPLAWGWVSFDYAHRAPQAKEIFAQPNNNFQVTILFAALLDLARRSPFLCGGLYQKEHGFQLAVRMPRGREGMPGELAIHVPPSDQAGSRPLLEPRSVLYSTSYYLDVSKFWEERGKLFNEKQRKSFEEFDKTSAPFLAGNRFSQLLTQAGPYQRFVAAHQAQSVYKTVPAQKIPTFAFVVEMREPEKFGKSMEAILRAAALLTTTQLKLQLVEEQVGPHKLIGYRFPEDVPLQSDDANFRFNFSPCFARVGNQFVASSTMELGRELVTLLAKEAKEGGAGSSPATARSQFYAAGGADLLQSLDDQLMTQTILNQGLAPEIARQQVRAFVELARQLGILRLQARYGDQEFHYDVEWNPAR